MKSLTRFGLGIALIAGSLFVAGCEIHSRLSVGGGDLEGSGPLKAEERTVDEFSEISVGNEIEVKVEVGPAQSVRVEAQENLVPEIETVVKDGRLDIDAEPSLTSSEPIVVYVTVPSLKAAGVSGASHMEITGLTGDRFEADLSGASRLRVKGSAKDVSVSASGGSDAVMDSLKADRLRADLSGGATVLAAGTAESAELEASGGAKMRFEELMLKNASVNCSGGASVHLKVADSLTVSGSGGSTVRYKGDPKVTESSTGGSTVRKMP